MRVLSPPVPRELSPSRVDDGLCAHRNGPAGQLPFRVSVDDHPESKDSVAFWIGWTDQILGNEIRCETERYISRRREISSARRTNLYLDASREANCTIHGPNPPVARAKEGSGGEQGGVRRFGVSRSSVAVGSIDGIRPSVQSTTTALPSKATTQNWSSQLGLFPMHPHNSSVLPIYHASHPNCRRCTGIVCYHVRCRSIIRRC